MTRFESYRGKRIYKVHHPAHGDVDVAAPDEDCAIVAAAKAWSCRWTELSFYAEASVYLM